MQSFRFNLAWNRNRALTIDRVFQAVIGFILFTVVYRYCWIDVADPYKCSALLHTGRWLEDSGQSSQASFRNWQPNGCIMHEYKKADIRKCLVNRRMVFIGDSTTRQIFWAVVRKLDPHKAEDRASEMVDIETQHKDVEFTTGGVTVQFKWDPWLNSSALVQELNDFKAGPAAEEGDDDENAALVLLGAPGLWYARHGHENYFKDFRDSIDRVISYMDHNTGMNFGSAKPITFGRESPNFLLLAPVQDPWYQALSPPREETITPEKIDQMNDLLQQVSVHSRADVVWSYSLMTWAGSAAYEGSGLHVTDNIALRKADVLLNLRCNTQASVNGYPFNRTCCSNYTSPGVVQWLTLFTGMIVLPGVFFIKLRRPRAVARFLPSEEVLKALWTIILAACYCFYADRSQLFEKSQKQFSKHDFTLTLQVIAVFGLLSIRQIKVSKTKSSSSQHASSLSRAQTAEWKGWMQFFILIDHYTHASQNLHVYQIIRLLVTSYLFMMGFGHTFFFLETNDYSFTRAAAVLFRFNLLSCILPYMMRTDYLFYYFAPLASFWFIVIYFTLRINHKRNSDPYFLGRKIVISAAMTTCLTTIPGLLEAISFLLKHTCAISWNVYEWRFRTFLDMYIVYIGMLLASVLQRTSLLKSHITSASSRLDTVLVFTYRRPRLFAFFSTLLSLILVPSIVTLLHSFSEKTVYNQWHPFISFIPILCFLTLRNALPTFRAYHSAFFAALGSISLETYVLQYHIWLAGDATGLLRLGVWNPGVETVLLTAAFGWVCWKVESATQTLTHWLIGEKYAERRELERIADAREREDGLTRFEDELGTLKKHRRFDDRAWVWDGSAGTLVRSVVSVLRADLKWRVALIGAILWFGNVTYT